MVSESSLSLQLLHILLMHLLLLHCRPVAVLKPLLILLSLLSRLLLHTARRRCNCDCCRCYCNIRCCHYYYYDCLSPSCHCYCCCCYHYCCCYRCGIRELSVAATIAYPADVPAAAALPPGCRGEAAADTAIPAVEAVAAYCCYRCRLCYCYIEALSPP